MKITPPQGPGVPTAEPTGSEAAPRGGPSRISAPRRPEAVDAPTDNDPLTADLVSMLNTKQMTPAQAVEALVERIIDATGAENSAPMKAFMIAQMTTDPNLRQLLSQIGVDPDHLPGGAG